MGYSYYKCENTECLAEFKSAHPFICPKCKGDEFTSVTNVSVLNNISPIFYIIALLLIVLGYITFNSEPPLEIKNLIIDDVNCSYTIITNQHSDVDILISTNKKDFMLNKFSWTKDEIGDSNFLYVKKFGSENVVDCYLKTCKDAAYYFNTGLDYYNKQKFDEAIIEFDKSILSDPSIKDDVFYYRGICYYALSKYDEAIIDLNKSIANWPNYRSPYYFRGICQERTGNYKLAIANFDKYISLSEVNSIDIDEEYNVYIERGKCYELINETNLALADYSLSIINWPNQLLAFQLRDELIKNDGIQIGQKLFGGIIFHIDDSGLHGLLAALEDLPGLYEWGCVFENVSGADFDVIGGGLENTLDIMVGCSETNTAAKEAIEYKTGSYDDWFLPSNDELVEMYKTIGNGSPLGNVGGFSQKYYWSSTELDNFYAKGVNFLSGSAYNNSKSNSRRVRVIRTF